MWIWLLAVLLVAGAWIGGTLLGWPLWLEILITVFAVLLVVGWLVGGRVRALLKARALERDLLKQAEEQARNARPDRRGEIMDLQAQMQRGLQAMRQGGRMGGGASALYRLPWYMIVGPPGAGKTTALRQSGLAFPFLDPRSGGGVRGVGGTRNCDWWFTNEAILLDTAGRYATEADDYDEWLAFLDTLRKNRPRKPINGLLVAISVTDLMEAREDQIDAIAKRLRARIDEIANRLQMIVPVYVLFTKVDLVAGFVEFWGDLRKSERGMIWGVTFPLAGAERRDPAKAFEPELDILLEKVQIRALRRVGQERQFELRPRIFQFPLEFAGLRNNLIDFVGMLLQPNNFRETPVLRGVYFTSGTQEGRPIDRVIGGMLSAFNMAAPMLPGMPQMAQSQTDSKSYFVMDLFRRVVFPDQHVAARTPAEAKRQLANRIFFSIAALVVAIGVVMPSLYTFGRNMELAYDAKELASRAKRVDWADGTPPMTKVHSLDDLHSEIEQLDDWHEHGAPMGMGWGMYAGDTLLPPLRAVYAAVLQRGFVTPIKTQLEHELAPIAGTHPTIEQYNVYFTRLKAYLSMTDPKRIQGEDGDRETSVLTDQWARYLMVTAPVDKAALRTHVATYVDLVARGLVPAWTADAALVARVRMVLAQISRLDRDYSALVREANDNVAPISHSTIFRGSTFAEYVTTKQVPEMLVPGAFTRNGWESYVRDALDESRTKKLARDRWVLGESEEKGEQEIRSELKQLEQRYFKDYTAAWTEFLKDTQIRKPDTDDAALKELTAASEAPWPMLLLLQTLAENTRLQPSPESALLNQASNRALELAGSAASRAQTAIGDAGHVPTFQKPKRWSSPVEDAFAPMVTFGVPFDIEQAGRATGLSHYLEEIVAKLVGVLSDQRDMPVNKPTPRMVATAYETAQRATNELLDSTQTQLTRPLLAPLLLAPVTK
jgi:type VI secretion system protein ImpL